MKEATTRESFDNLADVLDHLTAAGWKVTKSSLYRHHGEGKILPAADGTYARTAADRYAKTWLKQASTGKRIRDRLDELQRRKIEMELKNLDLDNRRKEISLGKDQDRYIPKEQMEIELATRAGIIDAGLKHLVQAHAAEWIRLADGDTKKVGELISQVNRELDELLNSYAAPGEYDTEIDEAEEPEEKEEERENDATS